MLYSRKLLVGTWHRNDTNTDGCLVTEYAQIALDGSFQFTFIYHNKAGEIVDEVIEFGDWGLVGDCHFTITKSELVNEQHYAVDLAEPDNYNAYRVLALTNQTFKYQHVISQEIFIARRITGKAGSC